MRNVTKYLSMLMVVLSMLIFASQLNATVLYTQNWGTGSGGVPPAGWAINQEGYGLWTSFAASGSYPAASPYPGCTIMVIFNSWDAPAGYMNELYQTASVSTVGYQNISVDFAMYYQNSFTGGDGIDIYYSTNGSTWTHAGSHYSNYSSSGDFWQVNTQALGAGAAGQATLYVAFLFTSEYGYDVYMDIMHVNGTQTGNITGTIRNCNTNAVVPGVSVWCGGVGPVLTNASGVYTINGIPSGSETLSSVMTGFYTYTATVTIPVNGTLTDNFCMISYPTVLRPGDGNQCRQSILWY